MGSKVRSIRLNEGLLSAAEVQAGERGTTLNAVIGELLAGWVGTQADEAVTHPRSEAVLQDGEAGTPPWEEQAKNEVFQAATGALEGLGPKHLHRMKIVEGTTHYVGGRPHSITRCECGHEGRRVG